MTIRNTGAQPDRLLSARTPLARTVELHTHVRDGEVMRMRPVADIPVPAGQMVRLRPDGSAVPMMLAETPWQRDAWALTALRLEDDRAAALGIGVRGVRLRGFVFVSVATDVAVAFVGTIGFVGLVASHVARMLLGENQRVLLVACNAQEPALHRASTLALPVSFNGCCMASLP